MQFSLAWLWANRIITSVIAGPRTMEQWQDYVAAIGTAWNAQDEAMVDSLVAPGHPSTPGYNDPSYPFYGRLPKARQPSNSMPATGWLERVLTGL